MDSGRLGWRIYSAVMNLWTALLQTMTDGFAISHGTCFTIKDVKRLGQIRASRPKGVDPRLKKEISFTKPRPLNPTSNIHNSMILSSAFNVLPHVIIRNVRDQILRGERLCAMFFDDMLVACSVEELTVMYSVYTACRDITV